MQNAQIDERYGRYGVNKTEDSLECSECDWVGYEENAIRKDEPADDWWFACPKCGAICAHTPIDEIEAG